MIGKSKLSGSDCVSLIQIFPKTAINNGRVRQDFIFPGIPKLDPLIIQMKMTCFMGQNGSYRIQVIIRLFISLIVVNARSVEISPALSAASVS